MKKLLLLSSTLFFLFPFAVSASSFVTVEPDGWNLCVTNTSSYYYYTFSSSSQRQVQFPPNFGTDQCDVSYNGDTFFDFAQYGGAQIGAYSVKSTDTTNTSPTYTADEAIAMGYVVEFFSYDGSTITSSGEVSTTTTTQIFSLSPENGSTTGNVVNFGMTYFISPTDIIEYGNVTVLLRNIDQNVLLVGGFSPSDIVLYNNENESAGFHSFATSTFLGDGNYRLMAYISGINLFQWQDLEVTASTQFTVNQGTFIGNISQNSYASYGALLASTTATSTLALSKSCKPFSGEFDTVNCLAFLFIPDAYLAQQSIENFRSEVLTRFPLGYVTDFISILSTGTSTTVTLVDLQVPGILPGGGKTMTLTIDEHSLDMLLNATSSVFATTKQDDPRTFREITEEYWLIVLGVLTILYMLRRILGVAVIPELRSFGEQEPLYASAETMRRARNQNTRGSVYSSRGWDK